MECLLSFCIVSFVVQASRLRIGRQAGRLHYNMATRRR